MNSKLYIAAILSLSSVTSAYAQSVDALARTIAMQSPATTSASLPAALTAAEIRADNVLSDPTVELENLWGAGGINKFTASVSQEFQFPTVYKSRSNAANTASLATSWLERKAYIERALEAKKLIIDYIYNRRCIATLTRLGENLDSVMSLTRSAEQGGELTVLDTRKIEIEQTTLMRRIAEMRASAAELVGQINALGSAGADYSPQLVSLDNYPMEALRPVQEYREQAERMNPTLQVSQIMAESQRQLSKAYKAERLPSFSLGYVYNREEGMNFNGVNFSATLPLYSNPHRRETAELQALQYKSEGESEAINEAATIDALHASATEMQAYLDRQSTAAMAGSNRSSLDLLGTAYNAGYINLITYLTEANYFIEAELTLEESLHTQALTLARLNKYYIAADY